MIRLLLTVVILTGASCIDFRGGASCSRDEDCAGYLCIAGTCQRPATTGTEAPNGGSQCVAADRVNPFSLHVSGQRLYWLEPTNQNLRLVVASTTEVGTIDLAEIAGGASGQLPPAMAIIDGKAFIATGSQIIEVDADGNQRFVTVSNREQFGGGVAQVENTTFWLADDPVHSLRWLRTDLLNQGAPADGYELIGTEGHLFVATRTGVHDIAAPESGTSTPIGPSLRLRPVGLAGNAGMATWLQGDGVYDSAMIRVVGTATVTRSTFVTDLQAVWPEAIGTVAVVETSGAGAVLTRIDTAGNTISSDRLLDQGRVTELAGDDDGLFFTTSDGLFRRSR